MPAVDGGSNRVARCCQVLQWVAATGLLDVAAGGSNRSRGVAASGSNRVVRRAWSQAIAGWLLLRIRFTPAAASNAPMPSSQCHWQRVSGCPIHVLPLLTETCPGLPLLLHLLLAKAA